MRYPARIALLMALASAALSPARLDTCRAGRVRVPEEFRSGTCITNACTYASVEADHAEAFTQAAGHPPWGVTKFELNHSGISVEGARRQLKRIRVDVPRGLAANPQALPTVHDRRSSNRTPNLPVRAVRSERPKWKPSTELDPGHRQFIAPKLSGTVYNLELHPGLPLDFGITVEPAGAPLIAPVHLFLEGPCRLEQRLPRVLRNRQVPTEAEVNSVLGVKSPLKVLMSKLNFNGRAGARQLPDPAQRMFEHDDLPSGSRIL